MQLAESNSSEPRVEDALELMAGSLQVADLGRNLEWEVDD
jgi:hypothetical protein